MNSFNTIYSQLSRYPFAYLLKTAVVYLCYGLYELLSLLIISQPILLLYELYLEWVTHIRLYSYASLLRLKFTVWIFKCQCELFLYANPITLYRMCLSCECQENEQFWENNVKYEQFWTLKSEAINFSVERSFKHVFKHLQTYKGSLMLRQWYWICWRAWQ